MIAGLGKLGTALLTLPIGWIIVGILAIVVVSRYLYQNWDKVREKAGQCWAAIKKGLVLLGEWLWGAVDFLVTPFKSAFEKIKGWWEKLKGWFTGNPVTTEVNVVGNAGSVAAGAGNAPRTLRAEREMAFGGLVSRPTLSWIGEAGDEMVVPLTNRSRGQALLQEAGKRLGMPPQASQVMSIAQEAAPKMTQVMDAARKAVPKMTLPPVTSIGGGINKMKPEKEKAGKPEPGKQGKRAPMVFSGPLSINVNGASDPRAFVETMAAELQKLADSRGAAEAMGW